MWQIILGAIPSSRLHKIYGLEGLTFFSVYDPFFSAAAIPPE